MKAWRYGRLLALLLLVLALVLLERATGLREQNAKNAWIVVSAR